MIKTLCGLFIIGLLALCVGCDNVSARKFGRSFDVTLPPKTKLVTVTWKENNLWYLVRPMNSNEVAVTNIYMEKSVFGALEGSIRLIESK